MKAHQPSTKIFLIIWIILVVFHFTILGSAYLNMGFFNTPFIMGLAIVQMVLIILYFMEVRYSTRLIYLFTAVGFFVVLIQWTLTLSDFLTRQWH